MRTQPSLLRGASFVVLTALFLGVFGYALEAGAQTEAPPSATMAVSDKIRDGEALLPLQDWAPLANILMSTPDDKPASRYLADFEYTITGDNGPKRAWEVANGPAESDLLEFAFFIEGGDPTTDYTGLLDIKDRLLVRWTPDGGAYGGLTTDSGRGNLHYAMDFTNAHIAFGPGSTHGNKISLILCVRISPYWSTANSLGMVLTTARMLTRDGFGNPYLPFNTATPPGLLDTYPFDFTKVTTPFLSAKTGYSSSFNVFDITSGPQSTLPSNLNNQIFQNAWEYPHFMYTPTAEYTRPRHDIPGNFFDYVTGEWMKLRNLFPVETWVPVVGINVQSTAGPEVQTGIEQTNRYYYLNGTTPTPYPAMLREVNVVVQGKGGDPLIPGSNGFNPVTGLDTFSATWSGGFSGVDADHAVGDDFAFNGMWIFHDTNGNGLFDPPVKSASGGVTFVDYPMLPAAAGVFVGDGLTSKSTSKIGLGKSTVPINFGVPRWEYVSFPPDGGDPWWKVKLELFDGARRPLSDKSFRGYVGATPNVISNKTMSVVSDYFVVFRADSGYQDVSLKPGDGTGFTPGTEFRTFIEPRRFNAASGTQDGGIYVDSQCAYPTVIDANDKVTNAWQDDSRWTKTEPWWPERTLNASNAKPVRNGVEVHDLTLTYSTNSLYASISDIFYQGGMRYGYLYQSAPSTFSTWLDPLGLQSSHFFNNNTVGVDSWVLFFNESIPGSIAFLADDTYTANQFPYETVPFFSSTFDNSSAPRSNFYPHPPAQPTLPDYTTWPANLTPGMYPQASDWTPENRKARILHQHIEPNSEPTAMLGFNLVGVDDPVTNRIAPVKLSEINVAFWGPDFDPADLKPLDPNGLNTSSGVLLYQDDQNGIFDIFLGNDTPVPLANLSWRTSPELVDLDGDGIADDLNGDGVVNNLDRAWVLTLSPVDPWIVPISDERTGGGIGSIIGSAKAETASGATDVTSAEPVTLMSATEFAAQNGGNAASIQRKEKKPTTINLDEARATVAKSKKIGKAVDAGGNPGDDLFLVVRTSDKLRRFEQIKVFVPATLPSRTVSDRQAGIKLFPNNVVFPHSYTKANPEEGAVQDYFKYETMDANVPTVLTDLTTKNQLIAKNSPPTAILGIDASTNRGSKGTAATGNNGVGGVKSLTVANATWATGAFVGYFLIDGNFESFEITANTATKLTLLSGTPKSGYYLIAKDPTFMETVTVEFYDNFDGKFKLQEDLLPLDVDQTKSGVALYRDNILDANNTPGVFDPLIDIPVKLDVAPYLAGVAGEPATQVRFVFSTPGTDDLGPGGVSLPKANQTRHRQWIPDTFDAPFKGPDFFVVIRTSNGLKIGDGFSASIVSWGPNTPTEPDPDTFPPYPTSLRPDEFDVFSEFAWGSRGIGYITFFQDPTKLSPPDISGYNWVRSTIAQNVQTSTLYGGVPTPGPTDVVITSASRSTLPALVGSAGLSFTITGSGFGSVPAVTLNDVPLTVNSATNTQITVTIPAGTAITATPVLLKVTNTTNGKFAIRDDLFTLPAVGGVSISSASPTELPTVVPAGGLSVSLAGSGFGTVPQVVLNGVTMTISSATDTNIVFKIPAATQFVSLPVILTVTNQTTKKFQTRDDLFTLTGGPPPVPDVVISSTSISVLPVTVPSGGISFDITGSGFGTSPKVTLQIATLTVKSATDTLISVTVPGGTTFTSLTPMTLLVNNPVTGKSASRDDLISLAAQPTIISITPNHGSSSAFPIKITGTKFSQPTVYFGETLMPIQSSTATEIVVGFPTGGLPSTGKLDVTVTNASTTTFTLTGGFTYENPPVPGPARACFIATAAYGTSFEEHLGAFRSFRDGVLLKSATGAALVDVYYTNSPAIADAVVQHPALALVVRVALTPIAWLIEMPVLALGSVLLAAAGCEILRRQRKQTAPARGTRAD